MFHRFLVLAAVAAGTGVMGAAGAYAQASTPVVEALQVPAPRAGDAAIYEAGNEQMVIRFSQEAWFGSDGRVSERLVLRHEIAGPGWQPSWRKVWLNGSDVIASKAVIGSGGVGGTNTLYPHELAIGQGGWYRIFEIRSADPLPPACGLVHSLQGRTVQANRVVTSPGCGGDLALEGRLGPTAQFGDGQGTRLVLDSLTPLPQSISTAGKTWLLSRFTRGPPPSAASSAEVLAPPIVMREGEAPNRSGIEHSFPYDDALAAATHGLQPNALGDYLATRPGAYVAAAAFTEVLDGAHHRLQWRLAATDGSDAVAVLVTREGTRAELAVVGITTPAASVAQPHIQDVEAPKGPFPKAGSRAFSFAALQSLEARWIAMHNGTSPTSNAWGFSVRCGPTCDDAETETWIGIDLQRITASCRQANTAHPLYAACDPLLAPCNDPRPPFPVYTACNRIRPHLIQDQLAVDGRGRMTRGLTTDWQFYAHLAVGEQTLATHGIGPVPSESMGRAPMATRSTWIPVPPAVVAAISLVGVLAAAAYAFSPYLKVMFAGLAKDARQDHNPVRAALLNSIAGHPGIHYQALRRATGRAAGTVRHHLRLLEHDRLIVSHLQGGYRCYFLANGALRDVVAGAGVLKAESARRILQGTLEAGHLSMGSAASLAGITGSAATHHAVRLEQAGLLTRVRAGRDVELRPTSRGRMALEGLASDAGA